LERYEMRERRACTVIGADRTSIRYRSRRPEDAELRERLRALASERRRFGYRRLHVLLRREGHVMNRNKTQRLYREEGLSVRKRRGRKKATGTQAPLLTVAEANARWSVDFVHDYQAGPLKRGASTRRREDDREDHFGRSTIRRHHAATPRAIDCGEYPEPGEGADLKKRP
jgi:transposase InsO family protein